ncbi:MAG: class D sortase [Vicinamibacterales bacterium]
MISWRLRHVLVRLEPVLWVIAILCLTWVAWNAARQRAAQRAYEVAMAGSDLPTWSGMPRGGEAARDDEPQDKPPRPGPGAAIGRLEISRLGLSAMVAEGDDEGTLETAVGHLPDTPLPWEEGNSALAGHRDSFFRPLQTVRTGDAIVLSTPRGRIEYRVRRTTIVQPDELWVLDPAPDVQLTLITCYPFWYVGAAPKRYIVHATKVRQASVDPSGGRGAGASASGRHARAGRRRPLRGTSSSGPAPSTPF